MGAHKAIQRGAYKIIKTGWRWRIIFIIINLVELYALKALELS